MQVLGRRSTRIAARRRQSRAVPASSHARIAHRGGKRSHQSEPSKVPERSAPALQAVEKWTTDCPPSQRRSNAPQPARPRRHQGQHQECAQGRRRELRQRREDRSDAPGGQTEQHRQGWPPSASDGSAFAGGFAHASARPVPAASLGARPAGRSSRLRSRSPARRGESATGRRLCQLEQELAAVDRLAGDDADALDRRRDLGLDLVLHLHRLEHHQTLAGGDDVARRRPGSTPPGRACRRECAAGAARFGRGGSGAPGRSADPAPRSIATRPSRSPCTRRRPARGPRRRVWAPSISRLRSSWPGPPGARLAASTSIQRSPMRTRKPWSLVRSTATRSSRAALRTISSIAAPCVRDQPRRPRAGRYRASAVASRSARRRAARPGACCARNVPPRRR